MESRRVGARRDRGRRARPPSDERRTGRTEVLNRRNPGRVPGRRGENKGGRMKIAKLLATVAVAVSLAPAQARAQGAGGADSGKDVTKFLDRRPNDAALKREIDVTVEDADLRDVMDTIGRRVGRNIAVEPEIHENVTISLRKIPWKDAVDVIAMMTKCEVEQRGPVVRSEEH